MLNVVFNKLITKINIMKVKKLEEKVLFPAPFLAHWCTGPVECCEKHANSLVSLGQFMGTHVHISDNPNLEGECLNCINENK